MAIEDGIVGRLQRKSTDTTPVNTVTDIDFTSADGTVTPVTQDGELAWRFQGNARWASAITPESANNNGPGCSMAVRILVNSNGSFGSNRTPIASLGKASLAVPERTYLSYDGNATTCRMIYGSRGSKQLSGNLTTSVRTIVIVSDIVVGSDFNHAWYDDGGVTDAPDASSGSFNALTGAVEFDQLALANETVVGHDYVVLDFVAWNRALTDAEARAVATDIRAELPAGDTIPVEKSSDVPTQSVPVNELYNLDLDQFFTGTQTPFTYAVTTGQLPTGLSIVGNLITGTVTTDDSETGIVITATDADLNTATTNSFDINIDLSSWGPSRAEIESADESSGLYPPFLLNDFDAGDLSTDRFSYVITQQPSAGTLTVDEYSRFTLAGAPDGSYSFTYEGFKNGVSYGTAVVSLDVGSTTTVPAAPVINGAAGNAVIFVAWGDVSTADGYKVFLDGIPTDIGNQRSYLYTGLNNGQEYEVYAVAYNVEGDSLDSNKLLLTPQQNSAADGGTIKPTIKPVIRSSITKTLEV